jgi:hypothetical protein
MKPVAVNRIHTDQQGYFQTGLLRHLLQGIRLIDRKDMQERTDFAFPHFIDDRL